MKKLYIYLILMILSTTCYLVKKQENKFISFGNHSYTLIVNKEKSEKNYQYYELGDSLISINEVTFKISSSLRNTVYDSYAEKTYIEKPKNHFIYKIIDSIDSYNDFNINLNVKKAKKVSMIYYILSDTNFYYSGYSSDRLELEEVNQEIKDVFIRNNLNSGFIILGGITFFENDSIYHTMGINASIIKVGNS